MGRALLVLNTEADKAKASHWVSKAPWGTRIEFKASKRSLPQNDRLWAMLTDVAANQKAKGRDYSTEEWKLLFMHAWGREVRFLPGLDHKSVVPIGQSSSDLSKEEMTDLIEFIHAWGAENGVEFNEPASPPQDAAGSEDGAPSAELAADLPADEAEQGPAGIEAPDGQSAPVGSVDLVTANLMRECAEKFLALAADKSIDDEARRQSTKIALTAWRAELPRNLAFVESCLESMGRVVKGATTRETEAVYLSALIGDAS